MLSKNFKSKKWIVTVSLIILIFVVVIVVLIVNFRNKKQVTSKAASVPSNLLPTQQAQYLADKGEYEESSKVYLGQVQSSTSIQDTAENYYLLTALAVKYGNKADAQKYSVLAEQIDPNSNIADSSSAIYYQLLNNKAQAINYWQLAIKDANSNAPEYSLLVNQYKTNISNLEAKQ
jgi:tetratricopeptide (TPR) repeat protein